MKRGVIILVGVLVSIGIIFGILTLAHKTSSTTTNPSLTIWIPFDEAGVFNSISQTYLKSNPTVTLNVKYIQASSSEAYEAQVVNAIADGNGPDIWMLRNDWLPKHLDKSAPATATSGQDPIAIIKKTITGNLVDANVYNGQLYGLPMSADALALIYNLDFYNTYASSAATPQQKAAVNTVAATWNDLKLQDEAVTKVTGSTVVRSGLALGTSDNTFDAVDALSAFLVQGNVSILSKDNKSVAFNLASTTAGGTTLPATNALDYFTSFSLPSSANYSWNSTLGDPVTAFVAQKTGALVGYYSTLQQIEAHKPGFDVEVAPLVQPDGSTGTRIDYGNTWSLVVNKKSTNVGGAWSYLGYLAQSDIENQYALATGKISVAQSAVNSALSTPYLVGASQAKTIFASELNTMMSLSKPEWQQSNQILSDMIDLVVKTGQSPQTSVDTAASRFNSFVSQ